MKLWFQQDGVTIEPESINSSGQSEPSARKSLLASSRIKPAVAIFCFLEMLDASVTYWAVNSGLVAEGNHLIAQMAGSWNFILLKFIGAILSGLILLKLHEHFPKVTLAAAVSISLLYLGVLVWNSNLIIHALIMK